MNRLMLIGLSATALLATSCSNDEPVGMPQGKKTIGFTTFVDKSTRAANDPSTADITSTNISEFAVWAVEQDGENAASIFFPFQKTLVKKDNATNSWSYTPPVYWNNGNKYNFMAVAPYDRIAANETSNLPIRVIQSTDINSYGTIKFRNITTGSSLIGDGSTDLIVAVNGKYATTGVDINNTEKVDLIFQHMLSRVVFRFTNAMQDKSSLIINDIKITNAFTNGTAVITNPIENGVATNVATPTWTGEGSGTLLFGPAKTTAGTSTLEAVAAGETDEQINAKIGMTSERYLIPVGNITYNIQFTITRTQGTGHSETYTKEAQVTLPDSQNWMPGYSYVFSATLDASNIAPGGLKPIEFTADVNTWKDAIDDPTVSTLNN